MHCRQRHILTASLLLLKTELTNMETSDQNFYLSQMNRQLSVETPYTIDHGDIYTYYLDSFTALSHPSSEPLPARNAARLRSFCLERRSENLSRQL